MDTEQKFQSKAQLIALQVHAGWEKFENVVLYPFRKAADFFGQTHIFREPKGSLKLVK